MQDIELDGVGLLLEQLITGGISLNPVAERFTREELCAFLREKVAELAGAVEQMTPAQIAYRLPGAPAGADASDETHFDTSQMITHLASGFAFQWWGITRALGHERPAFPRPPEGVTTTGKNKPVLGGGGWSGAQGPELASLLHDTSGGFLAYVEALPEDTDWRATSRHPNLGSLTAHAWLCLASIHPAMHFKQLREMQRQRDFPQES